LASIGPNAGKTAGLQFNPDLQAVRLGLIHGTLRLLDLW